MPGRRQFSSTFLLYLLLSIVSAVNSKSCHFEAVTYLDCPCTNNDPSGCRKLPECTWDMENGDLCEADQTLPTGENYHVNNCPGGLDVFRLRCSPSDAESSMAHDDSTHDSALSGVALSLVLILGFILVVGCGLLGLFFSLGGSLYDFGFSLKKSENAANDNGPEDSKPVEVLVDGETPPPAYLDATDVLVDTMAGTPPLVSPPPVYSPPGYVDVVAHAVSPKSCLN